MNIIFSMLINGPRFFLEDYKNLKYLLTLAEEKTRYSFLFRFRNLSKYKFLKGFEK